MKKLILIIGSALLLAACSSYRGAAGSSTDDYNTIYGNSMATPFGPASGDIRDPNSLTVPHAPPTYHP